MLGSVRGVVDKRCPFDARTVGGTDGGGGDGDSGVVELT